MTSHPIGNSAEALPELPVPIIRKAGMYSVNDYFNDSQMYAFREEGILADRAARTVAAGKSVGEDSEFLRLLDATHKAEKARRADADFDDSFKQTKLACEAESKLCAHIDSLLAARASAAVSVPEDIRTFLSDLIAMPLREDAPDILKHVVSELGKKAQRLLAASPLPEAAKAEPVSVADSVRHWMGENDVVLSTQAYRTLKQLVASPPQAEPVSTAKSVSDLIATHQVPKAKRMAELVSTAGAVAQLQTRISDRPYSMGETVFEVVILDRARCIDGMLLYATPPAVTAPDMSASPDDLRAAGLNVAVHNDYRLHGQPHTFWLLTDASGMSFKGEGCTDAEALDAIRALRSQPKGEAQ